MRDISVKFLHYTIKKKTHESDFVTVTVSSCSSPAASYHAQGKGYTESSVVYGMNYTETERCRGNTFMFYVGCKSRPKVLPVCGLSLPRRLALTSAQTLRLALNSLRRSRLYPLSWLCLEQKWVLAPKTKHVGRCLILCYFNPGSTFNELPFS